MHSVKAFSVSHSLCCLQLPGVSKRLGGDMAGTADPNWPQWREWPCNIRLSSKIWVVSDCFCITCQVGFFPLHLLDCFYFDPWDFFLACGLPVLSLNLLGERSALGAGWCLSCWPDLTHHKLYHTGPLCDWTYTLLLLKKALLSSSLLA